MTKIILSTLLSLAFMPLAQGSYSPQEFESMYPAKCFEVDTSENTKNKSSFCRIRRLRFYRAYLTEKNHGKKGNIAQKYSMIKMRESIKHRW